MSVRISLITTALILAIIGSALAQTGYWSEPTLVPNLNTFTHEYYPSISPDGMTMYLARSNNIMITHWNGLSWDTLVDAGPNINAGQRQIKASVTPDNRTLYFTSWRSGGYGTYDIWRSYWQDSCQCWGQAEVLPPPISTEYMETDVQLSHDGRKMYISSDRRFSWGGLDIWCSEWNDTTQNWGEPVNLGFGLNMDSDDETPYPSAGGNTLYFASWGTHGFPSPPWMGPVDIFVAHYDGQNWGNLEIIPPPIATTYWDYGPAISNDGLTMCFATTRPGGPGLTDIYETHFINSVNDYNVKDSNLPEMTIFPNPSNGTVKFIISTNQNDIGILKIYDINGRLITQSSLMGKDSYTWLIKKTTEKEVPSGCYFAKLEYGEYTTTKKFMLIK